MAASAGIHVLPGDLVLQLSADTALTIRLGNGLIQDSENVLATKAGILCCVKKKTGSTYWIDNYQRRYVPATEDLVIGIVVERLGDNYRVDIGAASPAVLPVLAFEGATRRNRPALPVGGLILARVAVASRDMEPELTCVPRTTTTSSSSEVLGELVGGLMFRASLPLCRALLLSTNPVLTTLGNRIAYEIATGYNGRVWVHSRSVTNTVLVANAILTSEFLSSQHVEPMVRELLERAEK